MHRLKEEFREIFETRRLAKEITSRIARVWFISSADIDNISDDIDISTDIITTTRMRLINITDTL